MSCAEATAWRGTPSATPPMGKLDSLTGRRPTAMGAARLGAELAGAKQMRKGQWESPLVYVGAQCMKMVARAANSEARVT